MLILIRMVRLSIVALLTLCLMGALALGGMVLYLNPRLPDTHHLLETRLQVPLRIYTRDGKLLGEYGEKRRIPVSIDQVPEPLIKAFLAAEDDRFFSHPGVDYQGLLRAAFKLASTGEKRQGGSTITMQVARNFFLSPEKTWLRKLNEILLALKIERELDKRDILALYLNKIYFGHRAYGVAAAAQIYYGRPLNQLTLAQMAMIAGLPKAPSRYNPISDPARALLRRNYVLGRMHTLGFVSDAEYRRAFVESDSARLSAQPAEVEAPFAAEMVRAEMVARYGEEDTYTGGYRVYTTLDSRLQGSANAALRLALREYDMRHGYHGPERHVDPGTATGRAARDGVLKDFPALGGLTTGLVIAVDARKATVYRRGGETVEIPWAGLRWAHGNRPDEVLKAGDVIRLADDGKGGWQLAQLPRVEGAFIALAPADGAIVSLVGGFDYARSKFNRATQALRQPGSSFKPFIYSAALEKGFTPATLIDDAPIEFVNHGKVWRPQNYDGEYLGPTRLRVALAHSRNVIAVRVLQAIGVNYVIDYAGRFGLPVERLPRNLSLALGTATVTPLELAGAYTAFANGGYRVTPYFIDRIEDAVGETLFQAQPAVACTECPDPAAPVTTDSQAIAYAAGAGSAHAAGTTALGAKIAPRILSPQNVYLMNSLLRDVIQYGTGKRALALGRGDIAGKTGTTNEQRDAWFCGFNRSMVAVSWVGFDAHTPLGNKETGGQVALPAWMYFMRDALADTPELPLEQPPGVITQRIDPDTGALASSDDPDAIFEVFMENKAPDTTAAAAAAQADVTQDNYEQTTTEALPDQLF